MRPLPAATPRSILGRLWHRPRPGAVRRGAIVTLLVLGQAGLGADIVARRNLRFQPGLVLSVFAPGAHPDLADASILARPKVIYHAATKRFILDFKLYPPKSQGGKSGVDYAYVGVATATQPTGPFAYQGRFLGSGSTGWAPNAARMFVADRVAGPYRELGNPCRGVNPHNHLGPEKTFGGQSTFVHAVPGRRDVWIAMFDLNQPQNPITSGYIWLPLEFEGDRPGIRWRNQWDLSVFSKE